MPNAGRGVFANTSIKIGKVIEKCPIIEIPEGNITNLEASNLLNYIYFFGERKDKQLIALGYGSIYNHNYIPNAKYRIIPKARTIEFISIKNIKKDEEITVNYVQGNHKSAPLWFEVQ